MAKSDPVVSPADTIREKAQQIIDRPQSPYGGSESGEEAWHWTHDWLAGFARDVLALLAVGERDRQQIARLTEAAKAADTAMRWHYEDVVPAAEVPDEATAFEVAIALVRAVLAGEEDAGDEA